MTEPQAILAVGEPMTAPVRNAAVSRALAAGVVVRSGEPTAIDLAVWLAGLSAVAVTDPADTDAPEGKAQRSQVNALARASFAHAGVPVRDLMAVAGLDRLAILRASLGRLHDSQVSLLASPGERSYALAGVRVVEGAAVAGREPEATSDVAALHYEGRLASWAHVDNDLAGAEPAEPVVFDLTAVGRFRCRYSALLYLRALAWLEGPVPMRAGWRRRVVGRGRVEVRAPLPDAGLLMGIEGLSRRADIERLALGPARRELAAVGINLHAAWIPLPGYARVVSHLALTVSRSAREAAAPAAPARPRKVRLAPRVAA